MKAREILRELQATRSEFNNILKHPSLRIGFECEMMLAVEGEARDGSPVDPDSLRWSELRDYVEYRQSAVNEAFSEYIFQKLDEEWGEKKDEYTREWCERYGLLDSDDEEEDADEIIAEHEDDAYADFVEENTADFERRYDMDDFIAEIYGSNTSFMRQMDIQPIYGWNRDGYIYTEDYREASSEAAHEEVASELRHVVGADVEVNDEYHSNNKSENLWYVEPDASITDDGEGIPAEVVSAVYPVGEGLEKLRALFDWMERQGHSTDNSTGLHINISMEGKGAEDYDFLKMLVLFDENHAAQLFGRLKNMYTKPMRNRLIDALRMILRIEADTPMDYRTVVSGNDLRRATAALKKIGNRLRDYFDKYSSIRDRGNGVFEFRGMGGRDYHKKFDTIRKQVVHMANIVLAGADENFAAKEYVTKLIMLLDDGKFADATPGSGKRTPVEAPKGLTAFAAIFDILPALVVVSEARPAWFLRSIGELVHDRKLALNNMQRIQLRTYVLRHKLEPDDLHVVMPNDYYNIIADLMGWPLAPSPNQAGRQQTSDSGSSDQNAR